LAKTAPSIPPGGAALHLDISVGGGRAVPIETRRQRVDAEAGRLAGLGACLSASITPRASITTQSR
jgi:hypothetical protein